MKKFLFGLFSLLAFSLVTVSVSSCGGDDPVDIPGDTTDDEGGSQGGGSGVTSTSIEGKWAYSEDGIRCGLYLDINGSEITYMSSTNAVDFKDGVLYASQAKWEADYTFHYTVKSGKIVVKEYAGINFYVKDGKLHVEEDGDDEVFTKIKEIK